MADYSKHIVHTYPTETGRQHWYVVGTYLEAITRPPRDLHPKSEYLTAADLGLKDKTLAQMHFWSRQWLYLYGREDPHAEFHSAAYEQAQKLVSELTIIIDKAIKDFYGNTEKN